MPSAACLGRGAHDIIQAKILQNIYENPIVIADLSTRNPNVMLEVGMRLTTRKPTLLVAEEGTKLPFDTSIIYTEFYNSKLEYRNTQDFIEKLSSQIAEKLSAVEADNYRPYLEAFEFETVEPPKRSITSVEHLTEMVAETNRKLSLMDQKLKLDTLAGLDRNTTRHSSNDDSFPNRDGEHEAELLKGATARLPSNPIGKLVSHQKFGFGEVIQVEGHKVTVDFGNEYGEKRLLAAFLDWET